MKKRKFKKECRASIKSHQKNIDQIEEDETLISKKKEKEKERLTEKIDSNKESINEYKEIAQKLKDFEIKVARTLAAITELDRQNITLRVKNQEKLLKKKKNSYQSFRNSMIL